MYAVDITGNLSHPYCIVVDILNHTVKSSGQRSMHFVVSW